MKIYWRNTTFGAIRMAEYRSPQEGFFKDGHRPSATIAVLELHRLLAIFLSSKNFAELHNNYDDHLHAILALQEVEEDEITRILLHLAAVARVVDNNSDRVFESLNASCGKIYTGPTISNESNLSLKEACNKILNATRIRMDIDYVGGRPYFTPTMYLYGTKNGREWKALLDVIQFSNEYALLLRDM